MLRLAPALIVAAGLLASAPADACEAHAGPASQKKAAAVQKAQTSEAPDAQRSVASPAEAIDAALAGKCACSGASDCTCRKGACECARCGKKGGHHESEPLYESLKGTQRAPGLDNARWDASAGVFI